MAKRSSDIIVGLDIGTTKIAAVVGEVTEEGLDIIGIGTHPSRGLKKGVIVNIDSTVAAIQPGDRRGREHVRLRDLPGLRRHRRRPHQGRQLHRHRRGQGQGGPRLRRQQGAGAGPRHRACRSTATSSTCCRRSTRSTARTACASRWACAACGSRRACTSSPRPRPPPRTSSSAATAATWRCWTSCSSRSPRARRCSRRTRRGWASR